MVSQPTASEAFQSLLDLIAGFDSVQQSNALAIVNQFAFPGGQAAGLPGIDAAIEALGAGGFFTPLAPVAPTTPPVSVDTTALTVGAGVESQGLFTPGPATPIAQGVDLFQQQFLNELLSREEERAAIGFQVEIAQFLAEVARASPTRAASINAILGLGENIDFGFADAFLGGGQLSAGRGGVETGQIGGQQVSLPRSLSLNQLSFAAANPQIERFIADLGDFLGMPDIFATSAAAAIPTSSVLAAVAA